MFHGPGASGPLRPAGPYSIACRVGPAASASAVPSFSALLVEASEALLSFPAAKAVELADAWGIDPGLVERDLEEALRALMTGLTAGILERAERFRQELRRP